MKWCCLHRSISASCLKLLEATRVFSLAHSISYPVVVNLWFRKWRRISDKWIINLRRIFTHSFTCNIYTMGPVKRTTVDVEASPNDRNERKVSRECKHPPLPPDGGLHAWFIVFASFLTNGIVFGIHNCYGIIYLRLRTQLEQAGVSEAALKACKSFLSITTSHVMLSDPSPIYCDCPTFHRCKVWHTFH